jgi:hypothetical protein
VAGVGSAPTGRPRHLICCTAVEAPKNSYDLGRRLNWLFAFSHEEAIKGSGKALEHDPGCTASG